jgi:tRNA(Ile2) C34 agmatinyltransferase TiaS
MRQLSSEINKTTEIVSLTVVVFPTSPTSVTTGMSVSMASLLPRLMVTVRHQLEESRAITSAATNLKTDRSR